MFGGIKFHVVCYAAIASCNTGEKSVPRRRNSNAKGLRQTLLIGGGGQGSENHKMASVARMKCVRILTHSE